jgi:hypothetical protein
MPAALHYAQSTGHVDFLKPEAANRRFHAVRLEPATKITGQLHIQPTLVQHADDSFAVRTVLMQEGGLPVAIEHCFGHGPAACFRAERLTARGAIGDTCTAKGMTLTLDRQAEQLVLVGCTDLFLSDQLGQPA